MKEIEILKRVSLLEEKSGKLNNRQEEIVELLKNKLSMLFAQEFKIIYVERLKRCKNKCWRCYYNNKLTYTNPKEHTDAIIRIDTIESEEQILNMLWKDIDYKKYMCFIDKNGYMTDDVTQLETFDNISFCFNKLISHLNCHIKCHGLKICLKNNNPYISLETDFEFNLRYLNEEYGEEMTMKEFNDIFQKQYAEIEDFINKIENTQYQ